MPYQTLCEPFYRCAIVYLKHDGHPDGVLTSSIQTKVINANQAAIPCHLDNAFVTKTVGLFKERENDST